MADSTLVLDSNRLRNRIAELRLKQWWLAEQLGVDRRTVLRWVNGQVRQLQAAHAERLAAVLGVAVADFTHPHAPHALATEADQRQAAHTLAAGPLLERLGPPGDWGVAEQLLRASIVPGLPDEVLAPLYLQLGVACWRQDKLAEAMRHNSTALELAQRVGDHVVTARALGSRANLHFWRGEVTQALADYRQALQHADVLSGSVLGGLHTNLGAALYETGHIDEGRAHLEQALQHLAHGGTPMNHAIVHGHLAELALREGDVAAAEVANTQAEQWAERADYRRGLARCALLRAEFASQRGDAPQALDELARADRAYAQLGIEEAPDHLLAARLLHRLGHTDTAAARLDRADERAHGFPLEQQAVQRERQSLGMPPRVTRARG